MKPSGLSIYIPTVGRAAKQKTALRLLAADIDFKLVVPTGTAGEYKKEWGWAKGSTVLECPAKGIRATRQWILEHEGRGKLAMLDDDLEFYARISASTNFRKCTAPDLRRMFYHAETMLSKFAHGGFAEKFMSQARPRGHQLNKRYFHILCYNTRLFPRPAPTYRTETGEDHDMNLQLLLAGKPGFLITDWAHADKAWAEGGCCTWRTKEVNEAACRKLAELFPGIVRLEEAKKDMVNHGGTPFTMRINWRKAAEQGGCR